jgi:hypothetical protein
MIPDLLPLIETLDLQVEHLRWYGFEMTAGHRTGCDGTVTSYVCVLEGLSFRLAEYVYTKSPYAKMHDTSLAPITYYEIEVKDPSARYGRRSPVRPRTVLPRHRELKDIKSLFQKIKKHNPIFRIGAGERMDETMCISSIIDLLKKTAPA